MGSIDEIKQLLMLLFEGEVGTFAYFLFVGLVMFYIINYATAFLKRAVMNTFYLMRFKRSSFLNIGDKVEVICDGAQSFVGTIRDITWSRAIIEDDTGRHRWVLYKPLSAFMSETIVKLEPRGKQ